MDNSQKSNKLIYFLSILSPILADFINRNNLVMASVAIVALGIIVLLFKTRIGAIYFFLVALSFSDFTFEGIFAADGEEKASLGGVYMASIGGTTLMVYWTLVTLLVLMLRKGNAYFNTIKLSPFLKVFLYCFFFSILGMPFNLMIGGDFVVQTIVADIRIFVNIFLGYFIVIEICKHQRSSMVYFNSFVIIIITQCFITVLSSYIISSQQVLYNFFGGTESFFIGFVFLFLLMSLTLKQAKNSFFSNKLIVLLSMFIILLFLFVVASRGKLLGLGVAVLIYLLYERKFGYALVIPFILILVIQVVNFINPNFINYFMWKFTTFNPLGDGGESSRIRYISLLNIVSEQIANPYYFLFGKGLGSFFEANYYSFENLLKETSFNQAWIREGKFYKPHGIFLYSLLKYGILMTTIIFLTIFSQVFNILRYVKKKYKLLKDNYSFDYIVLVTSSICLPYIYIIMFSSKLQIMFGILLGFIVVSFQRVKGKIN